MLPAAVSWFNASVLFLLLRVMIGRKADPKPTWAEEYRAVLSLFWLTAPLAWLYAIPVERFLGPYEATVANLWLLFVVATWRVVLMSRVVQVIYGVGRWTAFFQVMFFADLVAVGLMIASPKPMVSIMAGIAHTAKDSLILEISLGVIFWGILSLPVWITLMGCSAYNAGAAWKVETTPSRPGSQSLWAVAVISVLVWLPILPFTQAEQRLGHQTDEALAAGRIEDAVDAMIVHERDEFPPNYDPRPHNWPGRTTPAVVEVMPYLAKPDLPDWVREAYLAKLDLWLRTPRGFKAQHAKMLDDLEGRIEGLGSVLVDHRDLIDRWLQADSADPLLDAPETE